MQRLVEAVALRYVDDPQKRERMADELSEKWEKQHRTARQSDDEGRNIHEDDHCGNASAVLLALCAADVRSHEGQGGEPAHMGKLSGDFENGMITPLLLKLKQSVRRTGRSAARPRKAEMQSKADGWNRREAAAWEQLQEACADDSPAGQNSCQYRRRMYQANYSPSEAADFQQWLLSEIAAACAPPKSREELECEKLAQVIEAERGRRNDKGIAYWKGRAAEAGCVQ